jgi:hypothetical protein
MPRAIKATAHAIQQARAEWYEYHFNCRAQIKAMENEEVQRYQTAVSMISAPQMTIYGGLEEDYPERTIYPIAEHYHLDANLMVYWYVSEQGWQDFQKLWTQLPEPVDLYTSPCVQLGDLYTLSTVSPTLSTPKKRLSTG